MTGAKRVVLLTKPPIFDPRNWELPDKTVILLNHSNTRLFGEKKIFFLIRNYNQNKNILCSPTSSTSIIESSAFTKCPVIWLFSRFSQLLIILIDWPFFKFYWSSIRSLRFDLFCSRGRNLKQAYIFYLIMKTKVYSECYIYIYKPTQVVNITILNN